MAAAEKSAVGEECRAEKKRTLKRSSRLFPGSIRQQECVSVYEKRCLSSCLILQWEKRGTQGERFESYLKSSTPSLLFLSLTLFTQTPLSLHPRRSSLFRADGRVVTRGVGKVPSIDHCWRRKSEIEGDFGSFQLQVFFLWLSLCLWWWCSPLCIS